MRLIYLIVIMATCSLCVTANAGNIRETGNTHAGMMTTDDAAEDSIAHAKAYDALSRRMFAVEADRLVFKNGETAFVTSTTNFVLLLGENAIIQIAPFPGGGPNGVGGITVEGKVSNIKMSSDRKHNTTFSMNVMGVGVSANVTIFLIKGSNKASAVITPNYNSNIITLNGSLLPAEESDVYKGNAL